MYTLPVIVWSVLIHSCFCQLKACYEAVDEELADNFPCDPNANVSSCCASGNVCSSNLYCVSASNQQKYVGTCTDKTWSSPACPFNLTSGTFNPWYDKFNYALNTTQCANGTLCPFADNGNCCNKSQGIKEVHYNYNSSAVMPTDVAQLSTFYAAAGYTFPTSIPTATPTPTAPPVFGSTKSMTSSGLSHSDKVGLGIGITLCVSVCGISAILFYLSMRRRRRRQQQQDDTPKEVDSQAPSVVYGFRTELEGTPVGSEMEDSQKAHEVHEDSARSLKS